MICLIATTVCLFIHWYPRMQPKAIEEQQVGMSEQHSFFQYGTTEEEDNVRDQHNPLVFLFNEA